MLLPLQPGLPAGAHLSFLVISALRRRRWAPATGHHRTRFNLARIRLHQQPVEQPLQSRDAVDGGNLRNCISIFRLRPGNEATMPKTDRVIVDVELGHFSCRKRISTTSFFWPTAVYMASLWVGGQWGTRNQMQQPIADC